jgi:hypothetical protein
MRIILAVADGLSYREIIENLNTAAPTIVSGSGGSPRKA